MRALLLLVVLRVWVTWLLLVGSNGCSSVRKLHEAETQPSRCGREMQPTAAADPDVDVVWQTGERKLDTNTLSSFEI